LLPESLAPLLEPIRSSDPSTERRARVEGKLAHEMGPALCRWLADPSVIEVMLNPDGRLWVERLGSPMVPEGMMEPAQAERFMTTLAAMRRTEISRTQPILETELPGTGARFEGLLPPLVASPVFSIRCKAVSLFRLEDYVAHGILTEVQRARLVRACDARENILIAGGTGSGKTTFGNALIADMVRASPDHRYLVLEDLPELQCAAENAVSLRTSEGIDLTRLLRCSMRLRPDRIIIGEVRGPEALALIKSWNTGHPGGLATVHANSARAALARIEQLVAEGSESPMQQVIAEAVNLVVFLEKTPAGRRVQEIAEVKGWTGTDYDLIPLQQ